MEAVLKQGGTVPDDREELMMSVMNRHESGFPHLHLSKKDKTMFIQKC